MQRFLAGIISQLLIDENLISLVMIGGFQT